MIRELVDFLGLLSDHATPSAQRCRKFLQWLHFP
jgi:hypothetical protein